ncbi:PAS domain S-box protein [Halobacteriaceae archaeon GCM10025711]
MSLATMERGEPADEWRYEAIVDAVGDGVYQLDALGRIVTVNDAIVSLTGYDRETLVGRHVSLLMSETDIDRTEAVIRNLLETDERSARSIEVHIGTVDGDPVPCELRLTVVTDDDGALDSTVGVVRDVTDRRERKRALHEAQEKYRSVVDDVLDQSADVGVFILDDEFRVAWMNEAIENYFGVDRADVVGRDKRTVIDEKIAGTVENAATFAETVVATYEDNTYTEQFECHVLPGGGRRERYLEHRSRPIESGYYEGGRVELYYDVTDRRETELRMRHEKERFRSLVDAVREYAIIMLDADGNVVSWNDGAEQLTGYRSEEILGEHFSAFFQEEDVEQGVPAQVQAAAVSAGKFRTETWRVRKDGSRFLGELTLTPLWNDDGSLRGSRRSPAT